MELIKEQQRHIFFIGNCTYGILLVLAIIFYQERMLFIDMAYHSFQILHTENFAIQNNRYGAFFTQLLPVLSVKAGFSLKTFLILYSGSFVLFYYVLFFLCFQWLKQTKFALAILLHAVLMTTDTFYWIQSELQQGIPFLLFCFALFFYKKNLQEYSFLKKSALLSSVLLLPFFHPLLLPLFICCIAVFMLSDLPFEPIKTKLCLVVFILAVFIKLFFFPANSYDTEAVAKINNFRLLFPNYLDLDSNKNFIRWCIFDYNILIGLFCFCCYTFFCKKNYRMLWLQTFSFIGYLFFVNICYPENVPQFYMENLYLPVSLMVILPFVFNVAGFCNAGSFKTILTVVICIRLCFIFFNHTKFTNRISWEKDFLAKTEQSTAKKWILSEAAIPTNTTLMNWGLVYEFLLLSALENKGESRSILVVENPENYRWALPANQTFITKWGVFPYAGLPKKYFHFPDTSAYVILKKL